MPTKTKLAKLTIKDVRAWGPCYDPIKYIPEDWSGTIVTILQMENVSHDDRIWCALNVMSEKQQRLFAVWCAREALKLVEKPDPRSVNACDVAERFANGEASTGELAAARTAAGAAARTAARAAAGEAAWEAAWAAGEAARAAGEAARAAGTAAGAAAWAARTAAREAARTAQIKQLIKMVKAG